MVNSTAMITLAGFFVGMLVGITGVGGGALLTPMLVLFFGVPPATAVGTDLWFAGVTKSVGGFSHHLRGNVDWQVWRRLSLGSLPAAMLTLAGLQVNAVSPAKHSLILTALGGVLVITAVAIIFRNRIESWGDAVRSRAPSRFKQAQPAMTVFSGAILGVLVTLTSVGAGALGVVMLVFLYPRRLAAARLVGTDIVHAIPLTILAGTGHFWMGHVDLLLMGKLLLGSIPGIIIGAMLSTKVPEKLLRGAIAVALLIVGCKLFIS